MEKDIKTIVKNTFNSLGLFVSTYSENKIYGYELKRDIGLLIKKTNPVCLDVGANRGQSARLLQEYLKSPTIYCFEPSSSTFELLKNTDLGPNVNIYQVALGGKSEVKPFKNYQHSELSSFLDLDVENFEHHFGENNGMSIENVKVDTLDNFCTRNKIKEIDLLKIDTQGFDLEVLRGSEHYLSNNKIDHILVELNFTEIYLEQASPYDVIRYLDNYGMKLVDFYDKRGRVNGVIGWVDALFKNVNT